jgi:hypothetical protein
MALLKFRTFEKLRREVKEQKIKESEANRYKKFYLETLQKYGVSDASELDDDRLSEFLDVVKNYRKNNITEQ